MIWLPPIFYAIWLLIFGLCIGSFLNVCIARIPEGRSIVTPPSTCPSCSARIRWYDNIPLLSYLILLGRCRRCHTRISPVYPLVELAGGLIFFSLFLKNSFSAEMVRGSVFLCCLLVLFFVDLHHMLLPNVVTLPCAVIGILFALFHASPISLLDALGGGVGGALFLMSIMGLYYLFRGRLGMGWGDVKMMLAIGAFLGVKGMFLTLICACCAGAFYGLFLLLFYGKKLDHALPFGSFLAPAAALIYFGGDRLFELYVSVLQQYLVPEFILR